MDRIELNSLRLDELEKVMKDIGEKEYRADQLFTYMHRNQGTTLEDISVFSIRLRDKLKKISNINKIKDFKRFDSKLDSTKKYLFVLEDNNIIEGVLMEYQHGLTACISTQVGCRMGCSFCASTRDGLVRNLSPAEMLNQIYTMERDTDNIISNIVLMGSGEPLDNYDNVLRFLNIIHHESGHNISYRNITLSTCGIVPKIYELANENLPITLSISLHSPYDKDRKRIMPIGYRYIIADIMEACEYYFNRTGRRITIEYVLIKDVNDRNRDLYELIRILKEKRYHVNLIPLNPIEEFDKDRSEQSNVKKFERGLSKARIPVTIRREMGGDISASCGQLRRKYKNNEDESTF